MIKVTQRQTDELKLSATELAEAITDYMRKKHAVTGVQRLSFLGTVIDGPLLHVDELRVTTFTLVHHDL